MPRSCPAASAAQAATLAAVLGFVARVASFLLVAAGLHLYLWWRFVHTAPFQRRTRRILTGVIIAAYLSIPITTATRIAVPEISATAGWVTLPWLAFAGLAVCALVVLDALRAVNWGVRRVRGAPRLDLARRQFLARVTGGTAAAIATVGVADGMLNARGEHDVVDVEVHLPRLPRELDGFTIVQLSDLHCGMTIGREFVARVVERANALAPDLIALTGDLIDGKVPDLRDDIAPIAELRAPHGVFAVTGNHEYYAGVEPWIVEIARLGARWLRNEHVTITRDGASFELAGIEDWSGDDYGHPPDLHAALAGRDPSRALVLLAHQPRQVHAAAAHGVDLQLSGHTHGGQIWPWHYLVRMQQGGYLAGRYQLHATQLYVTRGCGYWGPPVRLLAPLEITRVILRSGVA
jgi:hypothetical protein